MLILSCYQRLSRIPRSLQNGLGGPYTPMFIINFIHHSYRRTKKKDIYVVSTLQRPVPLEHFLYARNETYKIVDAGRNFLAQGCAFNGNFCATSGLTRSVGTKMPEKPFDVNRTRNAKQLACRLYNEEGREGLLPHNEDSNVVVEEVLNVEPPLQREAAEAEGPLLETYIRPLTRIFMSTCSAI
jgi:hypothetical protein